MANFNLTARQNHQIEITVNIFTYTAWAYAMPTWTGLDHGVNEL